MVIHPYAIQSKQHLLSVEILSEWKIEFIIPYLVRNVQINARMNKLTAKCLLTFSHYIQGLIFNMVGKSM